MGNISNESLIKGGIMMESDLDVLLGIDDFDVIDKVNIDLIFNKIHRVSKIENKKLKKVRSKHIIKDYKRNKKLNRRKWIVPTKSH